MERRTLTMWIAVVAAAALVACGGEQDDASVIGSTEDRDQQETSVLGATAEREQEAPPEEDDEPAPSGSGELERTERSEQSDRDDDGETPWHLLPEEDRPVPVEQPDCEPAKPTAVAC